jgi:hypothetical protein
MDITSYQKRQTRIVNEKTFPEVVSRERRGTSHAATTVNPTWFKIVVRVDRSTETDACCPSLAPVSSGAESASAPLSDGKNRISG